MRRKKRKRKNKNNSKKENRDMTYVTAYKKCEHPMIVEVGKHKIFVLSWKDYEPELHNQLLNKLDVFIGLSSQWDKYEAKEGKEKTPFLNDFLNKVREKYIKLSECRTIIALDIQDRSISVPHIALLKSLLDDGRLVGLGCYACHGRTGWLLAELIKHYEGCSGDEAVRRIRKRLCYECVESKTQASYLECEKEKGSDDYTKTEPKTQGVLDTHLSPSTYSYYPFSTRRELVSEYHKSLDSKTIPASKTTPLDNVMEKNKKKVVDAGEKVFEKAGLKK